MKTVEPVRWKIRVAMTPKDLKAFLRLVFKGGTPIRLVLDLFRSQNPTKPPEDY
jgi:hypothetical protein